MKSGYRCGFMKFAHNCYLNNQISAFYILTELANLQI